jgi:hypothetical protein
MLLFFTPARTSALAFTPTYRVLKGSKHIATVTNGAIRPKRSLTKEETAGIRHHVVTELLDGLKDYPAIREMAAGAFGIEQTWPVPRKAVRRVARAA